MTPRLLIAAVPAALLTLAAPLASAKLPPLSPEAKAKADDAAAKTAWTDKVGAFQLCKAQDRVAAQYRASAKSSGKEVPAAPTTLAACTEPGPFIAPSEAKPLEASGAHSPPANATNPPSSNKVEAKIPAGAKK